MRVSVFGLGYVGCVTAACLARDGHEVVGVDVNCWKVQEVNACRSPVAEPGLSELIQSMVEGGRLRATCDARQAVLATRVSVICVGTPSNGNGNVKFDYLEKVCREIGAILAEVDTYHVVSIRSTVLPGTVEEKLIPLLEQSSGRKAGVDFGVVMNPEFLREGTALADYERPSFVVIGELDERTGDVVRGFHASGAAPLIRTTIRVAEMVKYVSNSFHAVKVAFANEIGTLCRAMGIDSHEVMDVFCRDHRLNISAAYLRPGFAFGGSCLPKDLRALVYRAKEIDQECPLLSATLLSNQKQIQRGIEMVEAAGRPNVGVLGLAFKAGVDDVRESPVLSLVETLLGRGFHMRIFDDKVDPEKLVGANRSFLERQLPHIATLLCKSVDEVVKNSDVIVVANGDAQFKCVLDLLSPGQLLVDLVGICKRDGAPNGHHMEDNGVRYKGICW